jgi:ATP phosphoribosyltransferase regulatory subunit
VDPPLIEYLDALLVGSGEDLDLQTLKVVDQVSGRQLGVRADMTSQAVRIDAHSIITDGVQRLCYAGPVVFASPQNSQDSRVPLKAGDAYRRNSATGFVVGSHGYLPEFGC